MKQRGFTLIEMGLVVLIISVLLAGVLVGGRQLIRQADRKAIIAQTLSIKNVVAMFRDRYRMLPGDFVVNTTTPEIPGLSVDCRGGGAKRGNGDGLISAIETLCSNEVLVLSGLADASLFTTKFPQVKISLLAASASGGAGLFRSNIRNLIVFEHLPCYLAAAIDAALDDGDLASTNPGKAAVLSGSCSSDEDAEVRFAVALQ